MDYRYVANQLGILLVVFGAVMATIAVAAGLIDAIEHQRADWGAEQALLIAFAASLVVGGAAWWLTRHDHRYLGRREALLLVAMSWIVGTFFAALPYFIWAHLADQVGSPFRSFENCYFEAMSGLTTTGATVLTDIEAVPRELLLWRAATQWIGGIGIVVLFVAVLPSIGAGGKRLFKVEAPGPAPEGLRPRIGDTARILWVIYLGLTALEILLLWSAGGMHLYDAVCHAFATLATGGFSPKNTGLGYYYDKPTVDVIVIAFMVLAGANFGLYYQLWQRRTRNVLKDPELRLYLAMLALGSVIVAAAIVGAGRPITLTTGTEVAPTATEALRQATMATVSLQTTTGFCTSDFDMWPFLGRAVLLTFMFVGGCSGSTAGGIKVIRIWIALKVLYALVERSYRRQVERPVKVGGLPIDDEMQRSTLAYVVGIFFLFGAGWVAIMLLEQLNPTSVCSSTSAATATLATLCTVGPGLEAVGPTQNYGWFSGPSKVVMCVLMALGRLEVFAIFVLLKPSFWQRP